MRPEQQIQQAPRPIRHRGGMVGAAPQLGDIAALHSLRKWREAA